VERVITAGDTFNLGSMLDNGDSRETRWTVERLRPEPYAIVRDFTNTTGYEASLRFSEYHLIRHRASEPDGSCSKILGTYSVEVKHAVSIAAVRNAPRDYTFTGRVLPARGQLVTLRRYLSDGQTVIGAQTRVQPDGTYSINRRFTGSGQFGFGAAVAGTGVNLPGESRIRPTVIH